jgi:prepilin peptidase CpaA
MQPPLVSAIAWAVFAGGLAAAAVWDIRTRRVPNGLNLGLAGSGLVVALAHDAPLASLLGALTGLGLLLIPFARGWVGAGDVKLLAAVGAWLGVERTVYCALAGAVFGGALAVVFLVRLGKEYRRSVATNLRLALYIRSVPTVEERPAEHCPPYALAIGLGAVATALAFGGPGVV